MSLLLGKWVTDLTLSEAKIKLTNDGYLLGRNNADSADLNMIKVNTSDQVEFGVEPIWGTAPSVGSALANKDYVDSVAFGQRDPKDACRVASTANVTVASAPANIDGVALVAGDRILLKDQSTASENGIYDFPAGGAGNPLVRSTDADEDSEVTQGMSCLISEGASNANKVFALSTADPIVVDTTNLTFIQVPSLGNLLAFRNVAVTLIAGDITNGYVDLAHNIENESINVSPKGGPVQEFGVDYSLSVPTTVTRVTFAGDLSTYLAAGDILLISYAYQP
jgi:hypothetical protein